MGKTVNVLIVGANKPESERILARLRDAGVAHEVRRVEERAEFVTAIAERCPDLVLADFSHRVLDGHAASELAGQLCPEVPFLFLSDAKLMQAAHVIATRKFDLEQFAHAASHDLQEPLRTISLFSRLLATRYKGAIDLQADDYLTFIEGAAQQMGTLLEDLSLYTQLPLIAEAFEPVDLNEVFQHTLTLFHGSIQESQATVTSGLLPGVLGTGPQLGLVFENLIENALKYHGCDPPLVHVEAASSKQQWVISVKDNGMGFPQQYAEQVFGLFKRLNKRESSGTGLGLAICRRIVEVHGGKIWADSKLDSGSTFYFTIPFKEQWQKSSSAAV